MRIKKRFSIFCSVLVVLSFLLNGCSSAKNTSEENNVKASFQIVKNMKIGWCLGNSLESCDLKKSGINVPLKNMSPEQYYETLWSNPVTSKKMIDAVAKEGFGAIRIPITYYDHMDDNYVISDEWLNRVEEVVKYVLDDNMYCIINIQHESQWLKADMTTIELKKAHLEKVWKQIADKFKKYNDHLLFEGFNEILDVGQHWTNADKSAYEATNQLNQKFVDTVRKSGELNKNRFLIVNTYAANVDKSALKMFKLPTDTIDDHLIVQVHTYSPQQFTWTSKEVNWDTVRPNWIDGKDTEEIDKIIDSLDTNFVSNGIPVIIGEFGAWNKNNTDDRVKYAKYIVSTAKKHGITCFWWDTGGAYSSKKSVVASALLNRANCTWYYPEIADALVKAAQ